MPELDKYDIITLVMVLAILGVALHAKILRRIRYARAKSHFIEYFVEMIRLENGANFTIDFTSRSGALEYVKKKVKDVRAWYAIKNGRDFARNLPDTYEKLVDELCKHKIIPERSYLFWK